ncbi:MAG: flagellar protein FlaG [Phreatobacter sp.]|uniref:flagellar protein FlaG n=1 Tax=Phreatobacter sp. TaxID=1966341 RepID=UPI001A3C4701|nr:flagellar protein FlaG [Phreatobacter sp.]MBL8571077.1 flagellar protein FlaG [Phreatobacter sp.]
MDIASHRPAVGSNSAGRPEAVQYREAVRTELPREQRVTQPVGAGASTGADDRRAGDFAARDARILADRKARMERIADTVRESLQRRIEKDDAAGMLVYRTVDKVTGEVVRQFPDDMVLKLKAYAREMARKDEAQSAEQRVERVA